MTDYTELVRSLRNCSNNRCAPCDCGWFDKYQVDESCKEIIMWKAADAIEALQAELPKRGEWIRVEGGESYHYECSKCGERPLYSRYGDVVLSGVCPMCGAKMEVQE